MSGTLGTTDRCKLWVVEQGGEGGILRQGDGEGKCNGWNRVGGVRRWPESGNPFIRHGELKPCEQVLSIVRFQKMGSDEHLHVIQRSTVVTSAAICPLSI